MTSLGIVDLPDSRVRVAGSASHSRQVTAGGAAFADVIQDAARTAPTEESHTQETPSGTATDDRSADPATAPALPPLAFLPAIITQPDPELAAVHGIVVAATAEAPAAPIPLDAVGADAELTNAPDASVPPADVGATLASTAAPTAAPTSAVPAVSGTAPSLPATEAAGAQPSLRDMAAARTPSSASATSTVRDTASLTAAAITGAASATEETPSAVAPRLAVVGSSAISASTPIEPPGTPVASARTATLDAAPTTSNESPDATATPASTGQVPGSVPAAAPTSAAPAGEALPLASAVGSALPPVPLAPAAAPAAASIARPVLLPQLTAPVVALAQAPDGDHSLTLTVSPENLGPVTVRAHISGGAIHIELHAPNDLGREALRAILADLRRDLAAAAPHASLLLSTADDRPGSSSPQSSSNGNSTPNGNAAGTSGGQPGSGAPAGRDAAGARHALDSPPTTPDGAPPAPLISPHGGIDVFA